MRTPVENHYHAWRVPTDDGTDYGVLVKCGPNERPYWWLLCPGTATLYIGDDPDLRDCQHGEACDFLEDVHERAHKLRQHLAAIDPWRKARDSGQIGANDE